MIRRPPRSTLSSSSAASDVYKRQGRGRAEGLEEERGGPPGPFEDLEVVRLGAGMPTSRFCALIGMPERTWRRHQARARAARPVKGPWPRPARARVRKAVRAHALAHPAWGHRKVWAMVRYDGHRVSQATVLRLLRDEGLILEANYQRERRELAANRRAAFATAPTGPNQVWQLDFSEFETTSGGTWRIAGCRDYWSKYEHRFHISPTAAIASCWFAVGEMWTRCSSFDQ